MSTVHNDVPLVTDGFVPTEAAHWMIYTVLGYTHECPFFINLIYRDRMGLRQLQLHELKKICSALKLIPSTHHAAILKGFQSARKANIIQRIRQCFYQDYPVCAKPSDTLLRLPPPSLLFPSPPVPPPSLLYSPPQLPPPSITFSTMVPVAAVDSSSRLLLQSGQPYAPAFGHAPQSGTMTQSHTPLGLTVPAAHGNANNATALTLSARMLECAAAADAAAVANANARHTAAVAPANARHAASAPSLGLGSGSMNGWTMPQSQQPWPVANTNTNVWNSPYRPPAPSFGINVPTGISFFPPYTSAATPAIVPPTYIKREGASQAPDSVPNSPVERSMLGQLQQFVDNPREILRSFRTLERREGRPPSIDEVIFEITLQRDAADEALQMDAARLLSEQTRKTDAAARRQQIQLELQARMETCTFDVWQTNEQMFPHSWLLAKSQGRCCSMLKRHVTVAKTELKEKVIELLKLERDARKWYRDMPRSYFGGVAQRLVGTDANNPYLSLSTRVRIEIDRLTHVMYTMSEQVGGVPKAFRDAHDVAATGASTNGQRVQQTATGIVDDDVILLSSSPSGRPTKDRPTAASANSSPTDASIVTTEMIDLCDHDPTYDYAFGRFM